MSVGVNNGAGQGSQNTTQTGNPQAIGVPNLQPTQRLQGSGSGSGVLGINSVLSQSNPGELKVQSSGTKQSTGQTETTPVTTADFSIPPIAIYAVVGLLVFGAISFIWSRRNEAGHL